MDISLSKINWLIHIRKLFMQLENKDITTIVAQLTKSFNIVDVPKISHCKDELYTLEDLIEEIYKSHLQVFSYDDFFQIVGNLRQSQDPQQSTCVNSLIESINELTLSEGKQNKILMRTSNHDPAKVMHTQQYNKHSRQTSRSPINRLKDIQSAQSKILAKISNIEQEIENKQLVQFKKQQGIFYKDVLEQVFSKEMHIETFRNLQSAELHLVLQQFNFKQIHTLIIQDRIPNTLLQGVCSYFNNLVALSLNSMQLTGIQFISGMKQLTVLSIANNQLTSLDGLQESQLVEVYCQNNKISTLPMMTSLRILNISNNHLQQIQCLLPLQHNKQLQLINCKNNLITQHQDYRRILYKLCTNIKAIDIDELSLHSSIGMVKFHYNPQDNIDFNNFSFSQ